MAESASVPLPRLLVLTLELALITLLIRYFHIGGQPFIWLSYLVLPAFVVHALLPHRFRLGFFLALSVGGVAIVAGPSNAAWLVLVVAGCAAVCLLPIPFWGRVSILGAAGVAMAVLRVRGPVPWEPTFWPIIASMLMFRVMVFLYDTHHEKKRPSLVSTFSYFLLLPNAVFPLFPVVDFKRFRSSHYSEPADGIYQRGLAWMLRGILQLVLYRIVYQFFALAPEDVQTTPALIQFMLSSYGLYLRVSGLFHLIVGQLLLFGFNLPETHHRYFLASSFNDFWRRINIYWKDFMLKLFYYPVYFRAKKWGPTFALVTATTVVFFLTWLLHAYQWFWLRGTTLFAAHDILFWGVLGAAVVGNSLWEVKHGRQRVAGQVPVFSLPWLAEAGRVAATFSVICILWSLWSADSLDQWLIMWRLAGASAAVIPAVIPASLLLSLWASRRIRRREEGERAAPAGRPSRPSPSWQRRRALLEHGLAFGILCTLIVAERSNLGVDLPNRIDRIRADGLNLRDFERQERGYYEHLLNVNLGAGVAMLDMIGIPPKPSDWVTLRQAGLLRDRDDFLLDELRPNLDVTFHRSSFKTNQWSMRDQEYGVTKPDNTVRIAVLGASHVMGAGVSNDETFEHLLEGRLNALTDGRRYEILNFGLSGRGPLHHLLVAEWELPRFQPDVVVYVTQEDMEQFTMTQIVNAILRGVEVPHSYLRELFDEVGLSADRSFGTMSQLLATRRTEIDLWAKSRMVEAIRRMGSRAVAVYLPRTDRTSPVEEVDGILAQMAGVGFETIDLRSVYRGHDFEEIAVAPWDNHPNPFAHGLIAERLMAALGERPSLRSPAGEADSNNQP